MIKEGEQKIWQRIKSVSVILLWKNKVTAGLIYTSLLMNALVWLGLFMLIKGGQNILIGHYNVFFGIDVIIDVTSRGDLCNLFLPAIGGLFFIVLSVLMSIFLILQLDRTTVISEKMTENFISNRAISFVGSRLLLIGAWFLQLVLLVYLVAIWLIN